MGKGIIRRTIGGHEKARRGFERFSRDLKTWIEAGKGMAKGDK